MNYKLAAIKIGDLLKYDTTINDIKRMASAIFDFPLNSFPNEGITSGRASLIYDCVMTLAQQPLEEEHKQNLLQTFLVAITPDRIQTELSKTLKSSGFEYNLGGQSTFTGEGYSGTVGLVEGQGEQVSPKEHGGNMKQPNQLEKIPGSIFIGHGHSLEWMKLERFLKDRLHLDCVEFHSESVPGITTQHRLETMLHQAVFAFLIMTAEEESIDGDLRARQNVVHEIGLFQGKLGFTKAIVLLEDGCTPFSNIIGLTWISFAKGNISMAFEEIRRVLEREHIIPKS